MQDFKQLVATIEQVHSHLQAKAANAVNQALTIRNWLIGYYIVEFEQYGEDRASYGAELVSKLAKSIAIKGLTAPELSRCRQFYHCYPQIIGSVPQEFSNIIPEQILGTLSQESKLLQVPPEKIVSKLSFSHLIELIKIDNPLKRTFYEVECIRGTWSVRELRRQISSLYYERSGLSAKPEKLAEMVNKNTSPQVPTDIIKNIYAFEFLDLKTRDLVEESDLESALLDHLQEFIIELGNGFCFEARQKRILIGSTYYFIDLLFYHRILKCHVLLELKIGAFEHGDIGQLNTYLNYFREEISEASDNPPVGILLVAEKDHALVKYATAGMDENLFVKQYLIKLPSTDQLQHYVEKELKALQ
ncbi:YhcG family protein [Telluribacter sp. SYSU D00476]|uniref:PDDEXK nuclease domain-containing protein n=1 Tax=Telluribacter sp. SYSU D00476 TaxID=2811430 RepID=UPI001FF4DF14|nr:PDDEXK nuclease domain-containing protein [Telluribacter sp. SYSU D00476]